MCRAPRRPPSAAHPVASPAVEFLARLEIEREKKNLVWSTSGGRFPCFFFPPACFCKCVCGCLILSVSAFMFVIAYLFLRVLSCAFVYLYVLIIVCKCVLRAAGEGGGGGGTWLSRMIWTGTAAESSPANPALTEMTPSLLPSSAHQDHLLQELTLTHRTPDSPAPYSAHQNNLLEELPMSCFTFCRGFRQR